MRKLMAICLIAATLASCQGGAKDPRAYLEFYSSKSPAQKTIQIGSLFYRISFLPSEYMAASYAMESGQFDPAKYEEKFKQVQQTLYYSIAIATEQTNPIKYNAANSDEVQQRIAYYTNYVARDIRLVVNAKDTLMPVDCIFENSLGVSNENRIVVAFNAPANPGEQSLLFNDVVNNNYALKSTLTATALKQLPKLKY